MVGSKAAGKKVQGNLSKVAMAMSPKGKTKKQAQEVQAVDPQIGIWETCSTIDERLPHLKGMPRQRWVLDNYLAIRPRRCLSFGGAIVIGGAFFMALPHHTIFVCSY